LIHACARGLVESQFPETVAADVLTAVGLDRDTVLHAADRSPDPAFCGYDGQVGGATVGVEAAHVRWFSFDGPDSLDNGLALCVLHHKLFDLGALGLDLALCVQGLGDVHRPHARGSCVVPPRPGTGPSTWDDPAARGPRALARPGGLQKASRSPRKTHITPGPSVAAGPF